MEKFFQKIFDRYPQKSKRFLEIIPGLISWGLISFPVWGSLLAPQIVAYYLLIFVIFWFYRSTVGGIAILISHLRLNAAQKYDWLGDVKNFPDWKKLHHTIIIPTYKEPLYILERTLDGLLKQTWPKGQLSVIVSFEQREGSPALEKEKILKKKYRQKFAHFWTTIHPAGLLGETPGKHSNNTWAAKIVKKKLIDEEKLDPQFVTLTTNDADAILHPNYFAAVSFKYLDDPGRFYKIYQSAILYYNNIWEVPAMIRVINTMFNASQMASLTRKDRLVNFSTYTTNMKMAMAVGFWDVDVIPEDYHFFFKSFFHYQGKVEVEPIFLPTHADAAQSTSRLKTFANAYHQVKRWAWGTSEEPYRIRLYLTTPGLPFGEKTLRIFRTTLDHFLWPVNWFAITLGATIPPLINPAFGRTALGANLTKIASSILTLSLIFLFVLIIVDLRQRLTLPKPISKLKLFLAPFEFILLPLASFFFHALPGLDAHTRLMLGKYLEYRVTEKV